MPMRAGSRCCQRLGAAILSEGPGTRMKSGKGMTRSGDMTSRRDTSYHAYPVSAHY